MLLLKSPVVLLSAALLLVAVSAHAESTCKGMEAEACSQDSSCRWVDSYTRKDGKEVKGYCRTMPKAKQAPEAVAPAQ